MAKPYRPSPLCCVACDSRTFKRHCGAGCSWIECLKCFAVSGIIVRYENGVALLHRHYFGGVRRGYEGL